jgi:TrwC relaxase
VKDKKTGLSVIHPETGAVQKREVSNRRVGYEFTFSVLKSVSLYLAVNQDKVVEQLIAEVWTRPWRRSRPGWKPRFARGISTTIA